MKYVLAVLISLSQVIYILCKGYFLSIEFTLYPYLVDRGFIPYKNILDQHFPSLFFGTFSLPLLSSSNPIPLLALFLTVLVTTNLLLYRFLATQKVDQPLAWLLFYVVVMCYFSVNILWVETFINLLLVISLNLSRSKTRISQIFVGLILSQVMLLRPTLVPCLLVLALLLNLTSRLSFLGLLSGLVASFSPLILQGNIREFVQLVFIFNSSAYVYASKVFPNLKQLFLVGLLIGVSSLNFLKEKRRLPFLVICLSLLAAFPRFGLEHLQPFVLFTTIFLSSSSISSKWLPYLVTAFFLVQVLFGLSLHRYGNYFFPPHLYSLAQKIKALPGSEIYLFGASDLLYPLSNKIPPGKIYIPSLPWYLNYELYQGVLLSTLKESSAPILIDTSFSVDGQKLIHSSPQVYEYIKMNYNLVETEGNFEFYFKKQ